MLRTEQISLLFSWLHSLIITRPTKEKSRTFLLLYNSSEEIANNIEYRANLQTICNKKESADILNIEKSNICYFRPKYTTKELHTIKNAFLIIIMQKRSILFYFYVLLLAAWRTYLGYWQGYHAELSPIKTANRSVGINLLGQYITTDFNRQIKYILLYHPLISNY